MLGLLVAGCSGPTRIAVRALAPVNTNAEGESLPVKVRIYALRDDARFRSAQFADLWTRDREALGDDRLQDPKVVVVPPGGEASEPLAVELGEFPKDTRFLGILALIPHADAPDRRRAVVASSGVGDQVVEILDAAVMVHDPGDPPPPHAKTAAAAKPEPAPPPVAGAP
jgi:type VI secretion system VasD/TssJ family lipoprotein